MIGLHVEGARRHGVGKRAMPFVEFWRHTFDVVVDEATAVTIEPSDIPTWLDDGWPASRLAEYRLTTR
jgi:hypothetical protein